MKIKLSFIIVLLMCRVCTAQNLVPNGDFETFTSCPTGAGQLNKALPWTNPTTATPDYLNQCAPSVSVGVPVNQFGFQLPHSGVAYAGLIPYWTVVNYREYLQINLPSTLTAGTCYHFEMYVSAGNDYKYTTHSIGAYFSDTIIGTNSNLLLPFIPQIANPASNSFDTLSWTLVSGNYTALGTENFLLIGNFNNDANTPVTIVNNSGLIGSAYLYIDDVSLTICTGINEQNINVSIKVFPNPSQSNLTITSPVTITHLKITNTLGQLIYQTKPNDKRAEVKINDKGIYFVSITTGSGVVTKKVVVE